MVMSKVYLKPETKIVDLQHRVPLLVGSVKLTATKPNFKTSDVEDDKTEEGLEAW